MHLDAETGEMVVANRIDFEQYSWLNFTVKATDSGVPSRASHVEVFVQILDENDNNPYFIGDITNITVREDAPIGKSCFVWEQMKFTFSQKITFVLQSWLYCFLRN